MLRIEWTPTVPEPSGEELFVIPISTQDLGGVDDLDLGPLASSLAAAHFRGKAGDAFTLTRRIGEGLQHIALVGTGDGVGTAAALRQLAHDASRRANDLGLPRLTLRLPDTRPCGMEGNARGTLVAEGLELGCYRYDRFRSEDARKPARLEYAVIIDADVDADANTGITRGQIIARAICRARDLSNGPAELITPDFLADVAQRMAQELDGDVTVNILEREDCEQLGMGCYLAVARGSEMAPKFIHLAYRPSGRTSDDLAEGPVARVCLVGKGITFDSGGYSLKPTDAMLDMKMDMAGAAAVLASFQGLVELAVRHEVHVIVPATENMISGRAYRLGDIFTASNGKTVEINNTDAEGRLTLADALVFADGLEPDIVIDFATLTGACMVALGPRIAGVMSRDDALVKGWMDAATRSGEDMWRLPLPENLMEHLDSKIADLRNTGERWGGALTAGLFLSQFCGERRWMHVDIAGPAMANKPYGVASAGGTGFAVATILELLTHDLL